MGYELIIFRTAEKDLKEGYEFYHDRNPKIANEFYVSFLKAVYEILEDPEYPPEVFGKQRKKRIHSKFSYNIYYVLGLQEVLIISVFHDSRDPRIWQDRYT